MHFKQDEELWFRAGCYCHMLRLQQREPTTQPNPWNRADKSATDRNRPKWPVMKSMVTFVNEPGLYKLIFQAHTELGHIQ